MLSVGANLRGLQEPVVMLPVGLAPPTCSLQVCPGSSEAALTPPPARAKPSLRHCGKPSALSPNRVSLSDAAVGREEAAAARLLCQIGFLQFELASPEPAGGSLASPPAAKS